VCAGEVWRSEEIGREEKERDEMEKKNNSFYEQRGSPFMKQRKSEAIN